MAQIRDEILLNKISLRFKGIREKGGYSQEQVFEDTGIHIARIEATKSNPSISTLSKLCKYFGLSLSEFFADFR